MLKFNEKFTSSSPFIIPIYRGLRLLGELVNSLFYIENKKVKVKRGKREQGTSVFHVTQFTFGISKGKL